jgi:DNA processing protein
VIDPDDIAAWLRLLQAPGLGRESARRLLASFASPQAVLGASAAAVRAVAGPAAASGLTGEPPTTLPGLIASTLAWLDSGDGRSIVTLGDPAYPPALLHTADPPLLLYAQGRLELLQARCIGVVGSRNPTAQGSDNARAFGAALSRAGFTVVSGMALGIDGAAHYGGLEGPGSTVAVVGTGLDRIYPSRHRSLAHRIASEGLLLSEFSLGTPPLPENFPQRNRLIAGLSLGTLVVEAALQSGSLITARLALEAGRDVFAIPGSIHSPQSRGCHALVKQGAKLVERVEDILEELNASSPAAPPAVEAPSPEDPVLDALGHDPATLDALTNRCGWDAASLNARLLELELDGLVSRLPGGLFQRRHRA